MSRGKSTESVGKFDADEYWESEDYGVKQRSYFSVAPASIAKLRAEARRATRVDNSQQRLHQTKKRHVQPVLLLRANSEEETAKLLRMKKYVTAVRKCDQCELYFENPDLALECLKSHGLTRCFACFEAISNAKGAVAQHFRELHFNSQHPELIQCSLCTGLYEENELEQHVVSSHPEFDITSAILSNSLADIEPDLVVEITKCPPPTPPSALRTRRSLRISKLNKKNKKRIVPAMGKDPNHSRKNNEKESDGQDDTGNNHVISNLGLRACTISRKGKGVTTTSDNSHESLSKKQSAPEIPMSTPGKREPRKSLLMAIVKLNEWKDCKDKDNAISEPNKIPHNIPKARKSDDTIKSTTENEIEITKEIRVAPQTPECQSKSITNPLLPKNQQFIPSNNEVPLAENINKEESTPQHAQEIDDDVILLEEESVISVPATLASQTLKMASNLPKDLQITIKQEIPDDSTSGQQQVISESQKSDDLTSAVLTTQPLLRNVAYCKSRSIKDQFTDQYNDCTRSKPYHKPNKYHNKFFPQVQPHHPRNYSPSSQLVAYSAMSQTSGLYPPHPGSTSFDKVTEHKHGDNITYNNKFQLYTFKNQRSPHRHNRPPVYGTFSTQHGPPYYDSHSPPPPYPGILEGQGPTTCPSSFFKDSQSAVFSLENPSCKECGKLFDMRKPDCERKVRLHMDVHKGLYLFVCKKCVMGFKTPKSFRDHALDIHHLILPLFSMGGSTQVVHVLKVLSHDKL